MNKRRILLGALMGAAVVWINWEVSRAVISRMTQESEELKLFLQAGEVPSYSRNNHEEILSAIRKEEDKFLLNGRNIAELIGSAGRGVSGLARSSGLRIDEFSISGGEGIEDSGIDLEAEGDIQSIITFLSARTAAYPFLAERETAIHRSGEFYLLKCRLGTVPPPVLDLSALEDRDDFTPEEILLYKTPVPSLTEIKTALFNSYPKNPEPPETEDAREISPKTVLPPPRWLSYCGMERLEGERPYHLFLDIRTGRLRRLLENSSSEGWQIRRMNSGMVLVIEDNTYSMEGVVP